MSSPWKMSVECPYCMNDISERQLFDLLNELMEKRKKTCKHDFVHVDENDKSKVVCDTCGYTKDAIPFY